MLTANATTNNLSITRTEANLGLLTHQLDHKLANPRDRVPFRCATVDHTGKLRTAAYLGSNVKAMQIDIKRETHLLNLLHEVAYATARKKQR